VAALDGEETVCVDTLGAVALELTDIGRADRAAVVRLRYHAALQTAHTLATDTDPAGGDPNPQPNIGAAGAVPDGRPAGSEAEQPTKGGARTGINEGDPNPQPNRPPPVAASGEVATRTTGGTSGTTTAPTTGTSSSSTTGGTTTGGNPTSSGCT